MPVGVLRVRVKLFVLIIFSIAFALVEAAVVFYLRNLGGISLNYPQANYHVVLNLGLITFITTQVPILVSTQVEKIELFREFSTLIMLSTVAFLAGSMLKQRIGAFLVSFAIWDIFYYLFLKLITGWPKSFFDIDIYFLIPTPWIGPVITPLSISTVLLIVGLRLLERQAQGLQRPHHTGRLQ